MRPWLVGLACLAVALCGTGSARDRTMRGRVGLALSSWMPFAIWTLTILTHAWRNP